MPDSVYPISPSQTSIAGTAICLSIYHSCVLIRLGKVIATIVTSIHYIHILMYQMKCIYIDNWHGS